MINAASFFRGILDRLCKLHINQNLTGIFFTQVGETNRERRWLKAEKKTARRILYPVLQAEEDRRYYFLLKRQLSAFRICLANGSQC